MGFEEGFQGGRDESAAAATGLLDRPAVPQDAGTGKTVCRETFAAAIRFPLSVKLSHRANVSSVISSASVHP